ncbi:hypothetical protein VIGAN_08025400, partial [Vigna angularis var. angularis]
SLIFHISLPIFHFTLPLTLILLFRSSHPSHSHFSVFKIRAGRGHYCGWFSLALKQYEGLRFWHPCVGQNLSTGSIWVIIAIPIFFCEVRFGVLQVTWSLQFLVPIAVCGVFI